MRIFITGATGVIGRRAVPMLMARGHDVTVATRDDGRSAGTLGTGVRSTRVDLFDVATLLPALRGHDVVINLATHMPSSSFKMLFRRSWRTNDRIRHLGVSNLVQAALANGVGRFVQESFAPTYPDCGDSWIDESVPLQPAAYNRTILDAESAVKEFSAGGQSGVVLRFAGFYGPDATQMVDMLRSLRAGWVPMPGGTRSFISAISHDDAATAVVAALDAHAGIYNVADDEPLRREEYFGSLAALIGARAPRFPAGWMTPLFGAVGELLSRSLRIANGKFKAETGWAPRYPTVREGWPAMLAAMENAKVEAGVAATLGGAMQ